MSGVARFAPAALSVAIALVVSAVIVAATGGDPWLAFRALVEGAFGSSYGLSEVAVKTCPLLLTGLAVAIAFRTGIWNIGAEGQLLAGAIAFTWLGTPPRALPEWCALPAGLLLAALAGALWSGLAGVLKVYRGVDEVIGTIMLNFIALGLLGYLVNGPMMEAAGSYPQSDAIAAAMRLPRLFPGLRVHAGLPLALLLAAATYVLLFKTVRGYELRAVGANDKAARLAGISVRRNILATFLLSGALAGLAGGIEVAAITFRLYERFSPGYGFTAIAVSLLGRLHPVGVIAAALLFGALDAGASAMQRVAGVSSVLVTLIQATVIFCLAAVEYRGRGTLRA